MKFCLLSISKNQAEHRVEDCKHEFEDVSKLIKAELDRFDKEKVEDLKTGIETLLESTVQTQKKVKFYSLYTRSNFVHLFFYLLKLDTLILFLTNICKFETNISLISPLT